MTDAHHAKPVLLFPEDVAVYTPHSGQLKIKHKATANALDWIENRLVFEKETFARIIHSLERSFNVKVNIHKASIKEQRFTGDFVKRETVEQILNVMSTDGEFKYQITGNIIDI
ncbi:MAG: DUF4974 domain-containing protein [Tannerellaceae bacterium]|jgi:ferric-dicitrate binding protein FerR (iron transport regulator)|nr:DUF4974 domain-containing protein [Tannerellaceae bacterium]